MLTLRVLLWYIFRKSSYCSNPFQAKKIEVLARRGKNGLAQRTSAPSKAQPMILHNASTAVRRVSGISLVLGNHHLNSYFPESSVFFPAVQSRHDSRGCKKIAQSLPSPRKSDIGNPAVALARAVRQPSRPQ